METPTPPTTANPGPQIYGQSPVAYGQEAAVQPAFRPGPIRAVWQGRWVVLSVALLALGAAYAYLSNATPIFESTSRIYVEKDGPMIMSRDEGMVMTQSRNYLHTQVGLFTSLPVLSAATEKLDINAMKTFASTDNPTMHLKARCLAVTVGKQDEIISVSARSPYPEEAAEIVNAVVAAYIDYHGKTKQTTAEKVLKILQGEKTKRDDALRKLLEEVVEFKKEAGVLLLENRDQNLTLQHVSDLWSALSSTRLELADATAMLAGLQQDSGLGLLHSAHVPEGVRAELAAAVGEHSSARSQLGESIDEARSDLRRLLADYTDEVPAVADARTRLGSLEQQLKKLDKSWSEGQARRRGHALAAAVAAVKQRIALATSKEAALAAAVKERNADAAEALVKQAEYEVLKSSVKHAENLVSILDERIREISVTENTGALNISILDVARPGGGPVEPRKTRTMTLALALGLVLGSGLVLLRDFLDHRLRSSDEMSYALGAPILGVLPAISKKGTPSDMGRLVHSNPASFTAEACRTVRTAVFFNAENKDAKVLLVTSPESGDGKSTVTSNLAIAMAQVGQRILVIDCDLRRPTQYKIFEFDRGDRGNAGLTEVMAGTENLDDVIRPSGIENLDVIPCLAPVKDPGEALNQPKFVELLGELSGRYDRILVDSPPVVSVADARILGALCDATVVVLRAEKSRGKVTDLARSALESVSATIMGVVVNGAPEGKGGHGEYGYYGVSGGYGYGRYYGYGRRRGYGYGYEYESEAPADDGNGRGALSPGGHASSRSRGQSIDSGVEREESR